MDTAFGSGIRPEDYAGSTLYGNIALYGYFPNCGECFL
jgi:hypothetical protein